MTRVSAAQVSPVVFDRAATLEKTIEWIGKAGDSRSRTGQLIVCYEHHMPLLRAAMVQPVLP